MPMLYRICCRARRKYIDEWERPTVREWDAAVKGSPALRASILSQMRDEAAIPRGKYPYYTMAYGAMTTMH